MQFGFQRFLNLGNPWKPVETRELGNMETHVPFLGNLTNLNVMGTVETYGNLKNLLGEKKLFTSRGEKQLLSKSVCYPEENLKYNKIKSNIKKITLQGKGK